MSKSIIEVPITLIQIIVQFIIVYNMMDLQGFYVYLVLASWGLGLASASVAVALGCLVPDVKQVTELAPLLFVPQILFAGFFVKMSQIPVFLRWAQYLCSLKYAMNLILMTEFDSSLKSCQGDAAASCAGVIHDNNVHPNLWWVYALLLFVLFVGFRSAGAVALTAKSKRFY